MRAINIILAILVFSVIVFNDGSWNWHRDKSLDKNHYNRILPAENMYLKTGIRMEKAPNADYDSFTTPRETKMNLNHGNWNEEKNNTVKVKMVF